MRATRAAAAAGAILVSTSAHAGVEAALGVGLGLSADLADAASAGETRLRPGPELTVPLRLRLLDPLRLRVDLSVTYASGVDELTWQDSAEGVPVRRTDADSHAAFFGGVRGSAGLEVQIPLSGRVRPFFAADVGVAGVGMFHALREEAAVLLDPAQNDLGDPGNIDPYTIQPALWTHAAVGATAQLNDRLELVVELGYGSAFVGSRALAKTALAQDARREAFALNPLRAMVGVAWKL
jgi:hypothetical protein